MLDSAGNLYFTDITTRVRVMTPAGVIYTVAGISISGFSGDGGRELDAQLYYPEAVALDNAGNLYICDSQNHRIRKVSNVSIVPMNLNAAGRRDCQHVGRERHDPNRLRHSHHRLRYNSIRHCGV